MAPKTQSMPWQGKWQKTSRCPWMMDVPFKAHFCNTSDCIDNRPLTVNFNCLLGVAVAAIRKRNFLILRLVPIVISAAAASTTRCGSEGDLVPTLNRSLWRLKEHSLCRFQRLPVPEVVRLSSKLGAPLQLVGRSSSRSALELSRHIFPC